MRTTIDRAGRLVVPKEIRREARLTPGAPLEVRFREGHIEIEPVPAEVRLKRKGRLIVAVPREPLPLLTSDTVERTREELLEDRAAFE